MGDGFDDLKDTMTGEEIVVTGMSGLFPSSDSVQEFMENLYNKVRTLNIFFILPEESLTKFS